MTTQSWSVQQEGDVEKKEVRVVTCRANAGPMQGQHTQRSIHQYCPMSANVEVPPAAAVSHSRRNCQCCLLPASSHCQYYGFTRWAGTGKMSIYYILVHCSIPHRHITWCRSLCQHPPSALMQCNRWQPWHLSSSVPPSITYLCTYDKI